MEEGAGDGGGEEGARGVARLHEGCEGLGGFGWGGWGVVLGGRLWFLLLVFHLLIFYGFAGGLVRYFGRLCF